MVTSTVYKRDVTGRVVEQDTSVGGGAAVVTRYGYTSGADAADVTLNASGQVTSSVYGLPGGVVYTATGSAGTSTWGYPDGTSFSV